MTDMDTIIGAIVIAVTTKCSLQGLVSLSVIVCLVDDSKHTAWRIYNSMLIHTVTR